MSLLGSAYKKQNVNIYRIINLGRTMVLTKVRSLSHLVEYTRHTPTHTNISVSNINSSKQLLKTLDKILR